MMWSWPGLPAAWSYAMATACMILFWTLAIFGAIVLIHYLGRENRPAVGRALLSSAAGDDDGATIQLRDRPAHGPARPALGIAESWPAAPADVVIRIPGIDCEK